MIVTIDKAYSAYTNYSDSLVVPGNKVADGILGMFNKFPQLYVHLVADGHKEAQLVVIKVGSTYMTSVLDLLNTTVNKDTTIEFIKEIPEGEGSAGARIAIGAAFIGLAVLTMGGATTLMTLPWYSGLFLGVGTSLIVGGISELVTGTPQLPGLGGAEASPTYSFSGIRNTTTSGTPIPICYGRVRVGGHIINAYTDVIGTDSYLYAQVGLSEGEVEEIDLNKTELNGRSATELYDIVLMRRNGTQEQEPLPVSSPINGGDGNTVTLVSPAHYHHAEVFEVELPTDTTDMVMTFDINNYSYSSSQYNAMSNADVTISAWLTGTSEVTTMSIHLPSPSKYESQKFSIQFPSPMTGHVSIKAEFTKYNSSTYIMPLSYKFVNTNIGVMDDKASMYGFGKIENTVSVDYPIVYPGGVANDPPLIVSTSVEVEDFSLLVYAPMLIKGGNAPTTVNFNVYYRIQGTNTWVAAAGNPFTVKGPMKSETNYVARIYPTLGKGTYDIKIERTTPVSGNLGDADDISLRGINELNYGKLIYPHTALLGVRVKAVSQLEGSMPTISTVIKGIKVKVPSGYNGKTRTQDVAWNGTLSTVKQWTDNPVWCLYDILTNKRYGLGKHYKLDISRQPLLLAQFKAMADYCDEMVSDLGSPDKITETVDGVPTQVDPPGLRRRFSLNIVLDEYKSAREWVDSICGSMRASVFYYEGMLWLEIDRPLPTTHIYTMSSISDFTQSSASYRTVPNCYEVQFQNYEKDYEQDSFVVETAELQADYTQEEYKKNIVMTGVTDERQVKSLMKHILGSGTSLLDTVSFKTGTQHVLSPVGSVVGIAHDVPMWNSSGSIESVSSNTTHYTITLTCPVSLSRTGSYFLTIQHKGGASEEYALPAPTVDYEGASITFVKSAYSFVPTEGDEFILRGASNEIKKVKIISIKPSDDTAYADITAVSYKEELYAQYDNISTLASTINQVNYAPSLIQTRPSVSGFMAEYSPYADTTGIIKTAVDIYYTVPASSTSWKNLTVAYQLGDGPYSYTEADSTGHIRITDALLEGTYKFIGVSTYKDGTAQTIKECLADGVKRPFAELYVSPSFSNNAFTSGVLGLEVIGSLDGSFSGKDCKLRWRAPLTLDALIGDQPTGGSLTRATSWLVGYEVEILNTNNTRRRITQADTESYTYTYEMNREDAATAARTFIVSVVAVDRLGRKSDPVQLTVSNAVPSAVQAI